MRIQIFDRDVLLYKSLRRRATSAQGLLSTIEQNEKVWNNKKAFIEEHEIMRTRGRIFTEVIKA